MASALDASLVGVGVVFIVEGLVGLTMLGLPLLIVVAYRKGGCLGSDRLDR